MGAKLNPRQPNFNRFLNLIVRRTVAELHATERVKHWGWVIDWDERERLLCELFARDPWSEPFDEGYRRDALWLSTSKRLVLVFSRDGLPYTRDLTKEHTHRDMLAMMAE